MYDRSFMYIGATLLMATVLFIFFSYQRLQAIIAIPKFEWRKTEHTVGGQDLRLVLLSICVLIPNNVVNDLIQVVRGGRRIMVSIYDLVVGDVIPLKIGDQVDDIEHLSLIWIMCLLQFMPQFLCQVPADGILISGHSLSIDESSMTGESKIVSYSDIQPWK